MRKIGLSLALLCYLLLFSNCGSGLGRTTEKMPGIELALDEMNVEMQLLAPKEANSFEIGQNLRLVAVNLTDTPILLTQDYGIKIFQQENKQWISIENDFGYPAGETLLLPKYQEPYGGVLIPLHPSLSKNKPVEIRVLVIGNLQDPPSSNKEVGAYIDLVLKP